MRAIQAPAPFRHTQYSVYIVTLCTICIVFYDSAQTIIQRYHINKKWFQLYGVTAFFAYLYVRPLIRKRLGSASAAYINWSTIYILWLCSAVFYHTPSLDSLGIDVKADISLLLTIFLISLLVLGSVYFAYGTAVTFRIVHPNLHEMGADNKQTIALVVLNALNLAMACSTFFSFCGNASGSGLEDSPVDGIRDLVCKGWFKPLPAMKHSVFRSWVIYGEENVAGNETVGEQQLLSQEKQTISPVFTMWLTLFMTFLANCVADYASIATIATSEVEQARKISHVRRKSTSTRHHERRHSAEFPRDSSRFGSADALQSGLSSLFRTMSSVSSSVWTPTAAGVLSASTLLFRDDSIVGLSAAEALHTTEHNSKPGSFDGLAAANGTPAKPVAAKIPYPTTVPINSLSPSFLPMFPWYSGTQADLWKTLFDVMVSVKVFLGRFDMRTMQAAVAGADSGGGSGDGGPRDGDGFTFEHLAEQDDAWIDFFADTGDGGDPTYSIARCLAAHSVTVQVPKELQTDTGGSAATKTLPRAHCIVHGGDLAYPAPSDETYEQRLFGPYEAALPPPSHVHPGHLVLNKPDLPAEYWRQQTECKCGAAMIFDGYNKSCKACQRAAALNAYDGPSCFLIPGNHDWFDGLETFQRHVIHKGWLGGWLLPQERSYFALRLPKGWWLLAMDLALVDDIDMLQYRYFARVAEERMSPGDAAIVITHCPPWLLSWFWGNDKCKNMRQLIRGPLRGRVRVQLAGDLHFYMRHTFQPYQYEGPPSLAPSELSTPAGASPAGGSPLGSRSPTPPFPTAEPQPSVAFAHQLSDRLAGVAVRPNSAASNRIRYINGEQLSGSLPGSPIADRNNAVAMGSSPPKPPLHPSAAQRGSSPQRQPTTAASISASWWPSVSGLKVTTPNKAKLSGLSTSFSSGGQQGATEDANTTVPQGWLLNEAEHLIICGSGGAFLHPTHVFSHSRFRPMHDPAAGPIFVEANRQRREEGLRRSFPSSSSLYSLSHGELRGPMGGEYRAASSYPTPLESLRLGRLNFHTFRNVNSRFDIIGGAWYYLLVVSVLPRCSGIAAIFDAHSLSEALSVFCAAVVGTLGDIFAHSVVSLAALVFLFVASLGFAVGGGVGVVPEDDPREYGKPTSKRRPEQHGFGPAVKARMGGVLAQVTFAGLHCAAHFSAAICLVLLLELGVETVIRFEGVGKEGYHSLYHWYLNFESQHFPDPTGLRARVSTWTLGLYPNALKWIMALFDVPEAIAVSRATICTQGLESLTRLQTIGYYGGVLAYFWVLATPTVGFLFGLYLYICVNWFGLHYDEAFSSLQVPEYKGFLRMHITQQGDLELYALGIDKVPKAWKEDPRWRLPSGGGNRVVQSHKAENPSRWIPVEESGETPHWGVSTTKTMPVPEEQLKLVDYLVVPKRAP